MDAILKFLGVRVIFEDKDKSLNRYQAVVTLCLGSFIKASHLL